MSNGAAPNPAAGTTQTSIYDKAANNWMPVVTAPGAARPDPFTFEKCVSPAPAFGSISQPTDLNPASGAANQVGKQQAGGAQVRVAGKLTINGIVDLRGSVVTVERLLNEIDGAGELVRGSAGADILPITLFARAASGPSAAVYESIPRSDRPNFRMEVKTRTPASGVFEFNLKVDRASMPGFPERCDSRSLTTPLTTTFTVLDGVNPPAVATITEAWRCTDLAGRDPRFPRSLKLP